MKQRGRRKLDCWVNGQSSVRIKNRIHLEGRGPEDGSVLLHVRGNEELCWSQLFHFRRNEFVQEVRERLRKRERESASAVSLSVEPSKTSSSQAQERAGTENRKAGGTLFYLLAFFFFFSKSILARILLVTSDKNKAVQAKKGTFLLFKMRSLGTLQHI